MAPRANWKGFLRLSLVTCPVALYPATSDSEKISFNQINRNTGHRIKYMKVDADTGEEVSNEDIMKGYKVDTDWKTSRSNPPSFQMGKSGTTLSLSSGKLSAAWTWLVAIGRVALTSREHTSRLSRWIEV